MSGELVIFLILGPRILNNTHKFIFRISGWRKNNTIFLLLNFGHTFVCLIPEHLNVKLIIHLIKKNHSFEWKNLYMPPKETHTMKKGSLFQSLKKEHIVDCQDSIWLQEYRGVIPLLLSLSDMNFRCAVFFSRPMIFASCQLMFDGLIALCLASQPSPVFILSFARVTFQFSKSVLVNLTLSICSFLQV